MRPFTNERVTFDFEQEPHSNRAAKRAFYRAVKSNNKVGGSDRAAGKAAAKSRKRNRK